MTRAIHWRSNLAVLTTLVFISASYEIKGRLLLQPNGSLSSWLISALMWGLSLFFANAGSTLLWNMVVRFRLMRRLVLGKAWIEGTWYMETKGYDESDKGRLLQAGVIQFSYSEPDLTLQSRAFNLVFDSDEIATASPVNITLNDDLRYAHQLERIKGNALISGIAVGEFFPDIGHSPTKQYSGLVIYFENGQENRMCRQECWKVPDNLIKAAHSGLGTDWIEQILRNPQSREEFRHGRKTDGDKKV